MPSTARRAVLCLLAVVTLLTSFRPKTQKVIFFGDSITQQGAKPGGFILRMKDALDKKSPGSGYELIGAGIGGNKVYDLYLRMDEDVLAQNPDIVFIWVGVNDVWHKVLYGTGTDADKFEKFYTAVINKFLDKNVHLFLVTPAVIGEKTDYTNQQDGDLNAYSQIVRNLAQKFHTGLVDLREIFHTYELKSNPGNKESGILTVDRVHLNDAGNQLVADTFLDALLAK
jgi:lysophospholipase L1-like esterase